MLLFKFLQKTPVISLDIYAEQQPISTIRQEEDCFILLEFNASYDELIPTFWNLQEHGQSLKRLNSSLRT